MNSAIVIRRGRRPWRGRGHSARPAMDYRMRCAPCRSSPRLQPSQLPTDSSTMRALALLALLLSLVTVPALAQTKWDLPSAYPANNFHTENLQQFVNDVDKATAGKLKITLHPNASLFKAPEIKRAVQGGQVQIGEILLVNFQNEWQVYGIAGLPFLADSYAASKKLYAAQKPALEKKLGEQGMMLLYAVP